MTIDEYAKAVAEAVRAHCEQEARDWDDRAGQAIGNVIAGIRLDAIIASVPKPEAQHHDAPTCDDYAMAIAEAVHDATMRHVACRHRDTFVVFDCPLDLDAIIASVPRPTAQHHVAPDVHPTGYPATVENIYNDPALNMARHQGRIEGWRRALNERPDMQALLEEEMRLRDKACAAHQAAAYARGKSDVQAQIDAAVKAYRVDMHECEQIAGRALGYPRYADDAVNFPDATDADGVCVGEHVAPTIVAELATAYEKAKAELDAAVAREREAWRSKVNAAWEDYWGTSFFDDYERLEAALGALRGLTDEQIVPDVEQHRKYTADEVQKTAQSAVEMMMDREREAWIEAVIANTGKGGEWLCSPAELVAQMPTLIRARSAKGE